VAQPEGEVNGQLPISFGDLSIKMIKIKLIDFQSQKINYNQIFHRFFLYGYVLY
jgi:hypothetical protein